MRTFTYIIIRNIKCFNQLYFQPFLLLKRKPFKNKLVTFTIQFEENCRQCCGFSYFAKNTSDICRCIKNDSTKTNPNNKSRKNYHVFI